MTPDQEREAAALMARAQQGDGASYSDLLTRLAAVSRQYARNRVGDVPWLDDVAQETLLTVHAARRTYDPKRPFAPWFYAILSSRMIDVLRRERRVSAREIGAEVLPEPAAASRRMTSPTGDVDAGRLHAALHALPAKQREIVSALKLRDESVKDVSARLNMTESAVKVAAHRGYRALRRLLGSRDA